MVVCSAVRLALAAFGLAACVVASYGGQIAGVVVGADGAPLSRAWVMTCNGRIVQSGADGAFVIAGMSNGGYALKAVFPGMADALLARLAVTSEVPVACRLQMTSADTAVVCGSISDAVTGKGLAAWFEAKSGSEPIRWFDVAGRPYGGRTDVPAGVWHQANRRYWTSGVFAFSAAPGRLRLTVRADGYAPATIERDVQAGHQEMLAIALKPLFDPAALGWYKGDFHAHGVHGERLYDVNIPMIAFMLRAENYRWFYLSSEFNNDGVPVDAASAAVGECGSDLLLFLNAEYPKTPGGHVGSVGIGPPAKPRPYPKYANVEVIKADLVDQGGAAVPVHPLYGHMRSRELPFMLLGAPELISGFDFYTAWNMASEKTWALFLNKGYRLCRTATSDTAFDLGRTPGTMGATFIRPTGGQLSRESIVEAFQKGRTTISWNGALLLFTVDGADCGTVFPSGDMARHAVVTLHGTPGSERIVTITRNGEVFKREPVTVPESGVSEMRFEFSEREKAWYTATCAADKPSGAVVAAASPFYFGDWRTPPPVLARVTVKVFDAQTRAPLDAEVSLCDTRQTDKVLRTKDGAVAVEARVFHRFRAQLAGYEAAESGVLSAPAVRTFIESLSPEDLQSWETYEQAERLLQTVELPLFLKRK
ncbi:MAG TPA: CehA/McbA family metallohydrolase [Kiritimatiellia bacterium]|nr:CehA/McbA family metallohydrolase [Kiritimatiellia bacterium]HRU71617.1 CehA/McbA family metallohydrolase [Kiritimatiellia bacterium]